ncbi:unnamed protein product, partial [Closterium sp. NIES-54]
PFPLTVFQSTQKHCSRFLFHFILATLFHFPPPFSPPHVPSPWGASAQPSPACSPPAVPPWALGAERGDQALPSIPLGLTVPPPLPPPFSPSPTSSLFPLPVPLFPSSLPPPLPPFPSPPQPRPLNMGRKRAALPRLLSPSSSPLGFGGGVDGSSATFKIALLGLAACLFCLLILVIIVLFALSCYTPIPLPTLSHPPPTTLPTFPPLQPHPPLSLLSRTLPCPSSPAPSRFC